MTDLRKAAEMAATDLEELISWHGIRDSNDKLMPAHNQTPEIKSAMETLEALRQALSQPDSNCNGMPAYEGPLSKSQALAQPEQEPVGWMCSDELVRKGYIRISNSRDETWNIPLYPAPPKREWVGLTDEDFYGQSELQVMAMKYAEAKLKEKNT